MASTALFSPPSLCLHLYNGRQDACEHEGRRAWELGIEYDNQIQSACLLRCSSAVGSGVSFVSVNLFMVMYLSFVICAVKGGTLEW